LSDSPCCEHYRHLTLDVRLADIYCPLTSAAIPSRKHMSVVSLRSFSFSPTYIVIDCIILSEQLGLAMAGITVGLLLGAPVGGALYGTLGYRAPFIFGIIVTVLDLVGRLLIIERKNALKYGWDPREEMLRKEEKKRRTRIAAQGGERAGASRERKGGNDRYAYQRCQ
jgi:hypothetical protein